MEIELHQLDRKYEGLRLRASAAEARLMTSIAQQGQLSPIIVIPHSETTHRYVVVDGFKRIRAITKLKQDVVQAMVWDQEEAQALVTLHHFNRSPNRSAFEDGWCIKALRDEHGLTLDDIARRLGRSKSWASRRLGLVTDCPRWLQDMVHQGHLQTYAVMKYFLVLARANKQDAQKLAQQLKGSQLSTREIGQLYELWRKGDGPAKELVVSNPHLALRSLQEARQAPQTDEEHLLQAMHKINALLGRVERLLDQVLAHGIERSLATRLHSVWHLIQVKEAAISTRLTQEGGGNDRSGDTPGHLQAQEARPRHPHDCKNAEDSAQYGA